MSATYKNMQNFNASSTREYYGKNYGKSLNGHVTTSSISEQDHELLALWMVAFFSLRLFYYLHVWFFRKFRVSSSIPNVSHSETYLEDFAISIILKLYPEEERPNDNTALLQFGNLVVCEHQLHLKKYYVDEINY